ncbi:MAG: aspartate-semialdehyde dehydrogenase [Eubacteriales bacterium]|nr:aspartate-semialdehyde dehydrogenase [Eubacteriales bacterium]
MSKLRAGIVGATGMVGQRLITLLENHPYFEISYLAASSSSAGKTYEEAVKNRWKLTLSCPEEVKSMLVYDGGDVSQAVGKCDFIFCAVDMPKEQVKALEEEYARAEIPVVSNNSANRHTSDVPMFIPEINSSHADIIPVQKKRLGTKKGFIAVKPNCSIQSYVPALAPLMDFEPQLVNVTTFQAISGAGKTFESFPEILDNVIPYIGGEEEKSEKEPLKIWSKIADGVFVNAVSPVVSAQCIRVPVSDGHLATVSVKFGKKPSKEEMLRRWNEYKGLPQELGLPHAPEKFLTYFEENNRPQTALDRDIYGGMGITIGRLREDCIFDYKFVCLSHNTLRGAAGGGVLTAEMLYRLGYLY